MKTCHFLLRDASKDMRSAINGVEVALDFLRVQIHCFIKEDAVHSIPTVLSTSSIIRFDIIKDVLNRPFAIGCTHVAQGGDVRQCI